MMQPDMGCYKKTAPTEDKCSSLEDEFKEFEYNGGKLRHHRFGL